MKQLETKNHKKREKMTRKIQIMLTKKRKKRKEVHYGIFFFYKPEFRDKNSN